MKTAFCTVLFLLITASPLWANELCEKAQIQSLKLFQLDQQKAEESCAKSVEILSANEKRILDQLIVVHQKTADLLKVELKNLFALPLSVEVSEYIFGYVISSASLTKIQLGVLPNDNFTMNLGVYYHELGHILSSTKNNFLPPQLTDLDQSSYFSESFSDLLALTLNDIVISPSTNPTCLDRLRYITDFQTYNYPVEFFQDFSEARIMKCCASLVKTSTDPNILNLCHAASDWFTGAIVLTTPFDPLNATKIDDHQVGIPILSFLKRLGNELHLDSHGIFEKLFYSNKSPSQKSYSCSLQKNGQALWDRPIRLHTIETLLTDFKTKLTDKESTIYDGLFTKHAIEKGLVYAELDLLKNIKREAKDTVTRDRKDLLNFCNQKIDLIPSDNCYLSCSQI